MTFNWEYSFWQKSDRPLALRQIHPCVIHDQATLVYHPHLKRRNKTLYAKLLSYANQFGWKLKADQRQKNTPLPSRSLRKTWVPIILLTCLPNVSQPSWAEAPDNIQLKAMNIGKSGNLTKTHVDPLKENELDLASREISGNPYWEKRISRILFHHWKAGQNDPDNIQQQLTNLAKYFSRFPQVHELFVALEDHPWQLHYGKNNFSTNITGSRISIDSVSVSFDPFSAAQFRFNRACIDKTPFCVASPADVLLHELLHAKSVLNNPEDFIAQGGMSSLIYPHAHEQQTIAQENRLYKTMSAIDQLPRPLRSEHRGRALSVACITCLK